MAAFLYCQMPVDSSQTTQLRLHPESPGHIKDTANTLPLGAIVPTKMCEQSYNSLEQLLSNKQYTAWKELAVYSVSFINDSNNTLVNAVDLLVHLCTALFPEHRYLDILRTVAMWCKRTALFFCCKIMWTVGALCVGQSDLCLCIVWCVCVCVCLCIVWCVCVHVRCGVCAGVM